MLSKVENKIHECKICHLYNPDPIFKPLPGSGNIGKFLIVGVSPSTRRNEMPSVNVSNPLVEDSRYTSSWLLKVLTDIKWEMNETYVTNFIKCTLPNNRHPTEKDIEPCVKLYFDQEVYTIVPQAIICLGDIVYDSLVNREELGSFTFEKIWHYAYIARYPSKYNEWKTKWLVLKDKYESDKT